MLYEIYWAKHFVNKHDYELLMILRVKWCSKYIPY